MTSIEPNKWVLCLAEFIGTALLMFLGCMGCITEYEGVHIPHYMPALTFGLTIMLIIQIFGHISGAHLNPAVSLVTVIHGILDIKLLPFYLIGQFTGAICGLASLKLLVPFKYVQQVLVDPETNVTVVRPGICTTNLHPDLSSIQGLILEAVLTGILILICCAIWDKRNETKVDSLPLRFGFAITAIAMASGPFSGCSLNTARSFAPALLNHNWENQWVYWVGPNVGAVLAALLYRHTFALPQTKQTEQTEMEEVPLQQKITEDGKV